MVSFNDWYILYYIIMHITYFIFSCSSSFCSNLKHQQYAYVLDKKPTVFCLVSNKLCTFFYLVEKIYENIIKEASEICKPTSELLSLFFKFWIKINSISESFDKKSPLNNALLTNWNDELKHLIILSNWNSIKYVFFLKTNLVRDVNPLQSSIEAAIVSLQA